jgi:membrane protein
VESGDRPVALRDWFAVLKMAIVNWFADGAPSMGAAIAFYALFSLAPILILLIAVAGFAFGEQAVRGELVGSLHGLMGGSGAAAISDLLRSVSSPGTGMAATIIGTIMLILAATAMLAELRYALNRIWREHPPPGFSLWTLVLERLLGILVIIAIAVLFMVSLLAGSTLTALGDRLARIVPQLPLVLRAMELTLTFLFTASAFLIMFKILPDASMAWRDIALGAVVAALLFTLGKYLISLYIGSRSIGSAYGAAGGLVILLVWIYFSAQILLFGAELAKACRNRRRAAAAKHP